MQNIATLTPNASHTISNFYTKAIYKLSTTMPSYDQTAQPLTQLKPMMKSNESLMTRNSYPSPQIILPPPSSPIMPPKPNTLLIRMNTNVPSKHYAKTAPLLLSMYQQYNT
jgi:hypothetical protein